LIGPFAAVHLAAEALPAGDRQDELQPGRVGHAGDVDDLVPLGLPALRHRRQRQAAIGVEREDADLEPVRPVHRMRIGKTHFEPPAASPIRSILTTVYSLCFNGYTVKRPFPAKRRSAAGEADLHLPAPAAILPPPAEPLQQRVESTLLDEDRAL